MNIQIFGTPKCSDTKKAERYFKERRIAFQRINLNEKPLSRGEFTAVCRALGGAEQLIDRQNPDYASIAYLTEDQTEEKLFSCQNLLVTPVVRNGTSATAGYCPDIWKTWN